MVVDFSIGNHSVFDFWGKHTERLFSFGREVVNGQSMEAHYAGSIQMNDWMIRPPWFDLFEASQFLGGEFASIDDSPDTTHVFK